MMATVKSVDPTTNIAVVQDQLTKTFNMPLNSMRGKGMPPAVDEQWIISREYGGGWAFVMLMNGSPTGEPIPQANVIGLPDQISKIDPAIARITAAEGELDALTDTVGGISGGLSGVGSIVDTMTGVPSYLERWGYGDKMSSMSRFSARDFIGFDAGAVTRYVLLGPAPRGGITVTVVRANINLVGTTTVSCSLYVGDTVGSMTEVGNDDYPTTGLGEKSAVFPAVTIAAGKIVAVAFTSGDTAFRFSGAAYGGTPGILTSPSMKMQAYDASPFPPNSINMSNAGSLSNNDSRIWCAIA